MPEITHLLWIDLETTGTDESRDSIIEVGMILTTPDLISVTSGQSFLVRPTDEALGRLMSNEHVRKMHQANGLLDEIVSGGDNVPLPGNVEDQIIYGPLHYYQVKPHQVVLAGSGVAHFDRQFISWQMPKLDKYLAYYSVDVGVLRRTWKMWTGKDLVTFNEDKPHRALDDIKLHLMEARAFKDCFQGLLKGIKE